MSDRPVSDAIHPVFVTSSDRPVEGWDDSRGRLSWATLFSAGVSPSEKLTAGVATVEPGGFLAPHRHPPPEIYYILEGQGRVTVDGDARDVAAGVGVFIPGNAEHGITNEGTVPLRFLYAFAVDRFEDVAYTFSRSANAAE